MANFRDPLGHHFFSVVTGVLAFVAYGYFFSLGEIKQAAFVSIAGYLSGIAPDIDSENSIPNRYYKAISVVIAGGLYASGSVSFSLSFLPDSMSDDKLAIGVLISALIAYFFWLIADEIMVHRGHFHSVFAAICFALFFSQLSLFLFENSNLSLLSFSVSFFGYCGHLLLDDLTTKTKNKALRMFSKTNNTLELALLIAIPSVSFVLFNS